MKKYFRNIQAGYAILFTTLGGFLFIANICAALIFCQNAYQMQLADLYLPLLAIISDIIIAYSVGCWGRRQAYLIDPHRPSIAPTQVAISIANLAYNVCFLYYGGTFDTLIFARISWYITDVGGICHAVYFALKAAHHMNPKWLAGTNGKIGIANRISALRIGVSALLPHIYLTNSFGERSYFIACVILTIAIATDKVDGTIARKTNSVTRAGMALDPIGDKVLFYPVAIAFAIINYRANDYSADTAIYFIVVVASAVIITARDAIILAWFVIYGRHAHNISATLADKIRMVILCTWLLSTAYHLGFSSSQFGIVMNKISMISLVSCAAFSVISVISDFHTTKLKDKF